MRQQSAQRLRLAVAHPSDVADAPVVLKLDEVEDDCCRLVEIDELYGCPGFAGRGVGGLDVKLVDIPVLRVDERIAVELAYLAMGVLSISDDQGGERRLKIAPNRAIRVERQPLGAAALVGFINAGDEGSRRTLGCETRH